MAKKNNHQNSKSEGRDQYDRPESSNINVEGYCYNTVKQIADDPIFCFTIPMLRYYVLHAHKNGLAPAIRRLGRKVLIRRDLFVKWLENQSR